MKWIIKAAIFAAVLVCAFFLLRTRILWLDYFDGTILKRVEKSTPTVSERYSQEISEFFFEIMTDDEREITVEVDQLLYFRARKGMRVEKGPFSLKVDLTE
jgi:hypothetical protein